MPSKTWLTPGSLRNNRYELILLGRSRRRTATGLGPDVAVPEFGRITNASTVARTVRMPRR